MKVRERIPAILALLLGFVALSPQAWAIQYLNGGRPGCLQFILDRPMDDATAKKLDPNCKQLRVAYIESLKLYSSSPAKFKKEIDTALKAKGEAYRAILFAALYHDPSFVPALEARAKLEIKNKQHYSAAAIERIKTGRCTDAHKAPLYGEVCKIGSPVVSRLIELKKGAK